MSPLRCRCAMGPTDISLYRLASRGASLRYGFGGGGGIDPFLGLHPVSVSGARILTELRGANRYRAAGPHLVTIGMRKRRRRLPCRSVLASCVMNAFATHLEPFGCKSRSVKYLLAGSWLARSVARPPMATLPGTTRMEGRAACRAET